MYAYHKNYSLNVRKAKNLLEANFSQDNSSNKLNLSQIAARQVCEFVKSKPNACLGLPTGRSPLLFYKLVCQISQEENINWQEVTCFGLDEYVDASEEHSFLHYLQENLYKQLSFNPNNLFNPLFIDNYDAKIQEYGGLDITILGLGPNGHIAFNEPGTALSSWTHSLWLTESTRRANAEFFQDGKIPTRAVSMGISTILASHKIILLAFGPNKQNALSLAMRGPISSEVPASFLQLHNNLIILADFDY